MKDTETTNIQILPPDKPAMYGWICPVCGRGLSPFTYVCPCKNEYKITTGTPYKDSITITC